MANVIATARSNFFKVKDKEAFTKLCDYVGVELIERSEKPGKVAFLCTLDDCGALPFSVYDEEKDDHVEIDIVEEVGKHLADGEVAVVIEISAEKYRSVHGYTEAINSKGERECITLHDIYRLAAENLGDTVDVIGE